MYLGNDKIIFDKVWFIFTSKRRHNMLIYFVINFSPMSLKYFWLYDEVLIKDMATQTRMPLDSPVLILLDQRLIAGGKNKKIKATIYTY